MIAQKYRLGFKSQTGLPPAANGALGQQFSNADEMFETLFTEARRVATLTGAGSSGDGGSSAATGYWTVLTDGDPVDTHLIFADGEAIAVFVPTLT
jgi:hypothetical protein